MQNSMIAELENVNLRADHRTNNSEYVLWLKWNKEACCICFHVLRILLYVCVWVYMYMNHVGHFTVSECFDIRWCPSAKPTAFIAFL